MRWAIQEFKLGEKVLQAGCVYGNFSMMLAEQIGEQGSLDVLEAAPIQVANCRQKVEAAPQVKILQGDAASYDGQDYDRVCSFFLLHEIPADHRQKVIANLLSRVRPGGDVVFVDYHKPRRFHPLSLVMRAIFRLLEPFAQEFIENSLQGASPLADNFSWRKKTLFGGLYQKVVATRLR